MERAIAAIKPMSPKNAGWRWDVAPELALEGGAIPAGADVERGASVRAAAAVVLADDVQTPATQTFDVHHQFAEHEFPLGCLTKQRPSFR
jgi:hypothetical protein